MAISQNRQKVIDLILWPEQISKEQLRSSESLTEKVFAIIKDNEIGLTDHIRKKLKKKEKKQIKIDIVKAEDCFTQYFLLKIICHEIRSGHSTLTPFNTKGIGNILAEWEPFRNSFKDRLCFTVTFPSSQDLPMPVQKQTKLYEIEEEFDSDSADIDTALMTKVIVYVKQGANNVDVIQQSKRIPMTNIPSTHLWKTTLKWQTEDVQSFDIDVTYEEFSIMSLGRTEKTKSWLNVQHEPTDPYAFFNCSDDRTVSTQQIIDYIIGVVATESMKDAILQLEHILKDKPYGPESISVSLKNFTNFQLKSYAQTFSQRRALSEDNVIAYCFFISYSMLYADIQISPSISDMTIQTLRQLESDSLPSTSTQSIGRVALHICKQAYGEEFSFVLFISLFLTVLGENTCLLLMNKYESLPIYRASSQFAVPAFLNRLHMLSYDNSDVFKIETKIFNSFTMEEHIYFHNECVLRFNWATDDRRANFEELLSSKIILELERNGSERNVRNIFHIWKDSVALKMTNNKICINFEQALLKALENANSRNFCTDDILTIFTSSQVFHKKGVLEQLMQVLTESNDKSIHFIVIEMLNSKKMRCMDIDNVYSIIGMWLTRLIKSLTFKEQPDNDIFVAYWYYLKLTSSNFASLYPEKNKKLETFLLKMIDGLKIEIMMSAIDKFDKCLEVPVAELYTTHLKKVFTDQNKLKSMNTLMEALLMPSGRLDISSRVRNSLLEYALERFDLQENDTFENAFSKMLDSTHFWRHIFSISVVQHSDKNEIMGHPKIKLAMKFAKETARAIIEQNVSCSFIADLRPKKRNVEDVLRIFVKKDRILTPMDACDAVLNQYKDNLKKIEDVFKELETGVWELSQFCSDIQEYILIRRKELTKGFLTIAELFAANSDYLLIEEMAYHCKLIDEAVLSKVFINVVKSLLPSVECQEDDMLDGISLPFLFKEREDMIFDLERLHKLRMDVNKFKLVVSKCLHHYKSIWTSCDENGQQEVLYINRIFHGIDDIDIELQKAQTISGLKFSEVCKKSLMRFSNIRQYAETVDTIKAADFAFEFSREDESVFFVAVKRFDNILNGDLKGVTLTELVPLLDDIDSIHHMIDKEAQNILQAVGKASSLLDFLREVIDEDIRNLIDAVEEHSEQYVTESTVSDLIEIKRFFDPVLRGNFKDDIAGLFRVLQKQVQQSGIQNVPEKVYVCRDNLHSLMALYKNVANRGERTVEVIENITAEGAFKFQQNRKSCEVVVEYKQNGKPYTYSKSDLSDLRSRALLLMNAEKYKEGHNSRKEQLIAFVELVENAFGVVALCMNLQEAGHFEFADFYVNCHTDEMSSLIDQLQSKYNEWESEIEDCRKEFYYMNFLYSDQLYELYRYLTTGDQNNKTNVAAVLRFINPILQQIQPISVIYNGKHHNKSNKATLRNIGETLQEFFSRLETPEPILIKTEGDVKIIDKVQPGRPFIVSLDEESPLVIKTILALYLNSTNKFPEANQILLCRADTTFDEINLLLRRCLLRKENQSDTLYCVANIEKLDGEVQFKLHDEIRRLPQGNYLICFFCRGHVNHPFLDKFADILSKPSPLQDEQLQRCLEKYWSNVRVVTSEVPGLGKTEYIQNQAILEKNRTVCLHISGPMNRRHIIEDLILLQLKPYHTLHIDIGTVSDPFELDLFLFELIVLRYVSAGSTAYALQSRKIDIEIANTVNDTLRNALPVVTCFKRKHIKWENYNDLRVSKEMCSPIQVVCHYLKSEGRGMLDNEDIYFTGKMKVQPLPFSECRDLLRTHFSASSDMSYTLVNIFLRFLADQLKKLSSSLYFRTENLQAMLGVNYTSARIKSNLVNELTNTSKEFSERSVHSCRSKQAATMTGKDSATALANRVSGMIRWEESNHLVILFHQQTGTVSPLYRNVNQVPKSIIELFKSQNGSDLMDFKFKSNEELEEILIKLVRNSSSISSDQLLTKLRKEYALTPDNLLKMILISLRVNTRLPVLIMGETGCGKTSLIQYLAEVSGVDFEIFTVHAGIDEAKIKDKLREISIKAHKSLSLQYWVFLDEINTCDNLGLISSILCHRFCQDITMPPNLVLLAACNPYRLRKTDAIMTAGLQGLKIKTDELSRLVYRVHPLPETLLDYVWDFGSLSEEDEKSYIKKMVTAVFGQSWFVSLLTDLLVASQHFVRETEETEYSVSLRDVDRCRRLTKWFNVFLEKKNENRGDMKAQNIRAIILGLAVCYQSRFSQNDVRHRYRQVLSKVFDGSKIKYSEEDIAEVVLDEQLFILKKMVVPDGIALNAALQENVFMLLVCILNKIPIFLVGKPGCSKSLSMQLIRSNLRGKDSTDKLFQDMPQLFCVSFQGSESSTSDGILKVFEKAEKYQKHNDAKDVLSVVILDEIGLAEISRFNPLKILHGLLEPGRGKDLNIAVVGISNWALDAAKMNRAIHLSRPDMNVKELEYTGKSISSSIVGTRQGIDRWSILPTQTPKNEEWNAKIVHLLEGIARGYNEYDCTHGKKFQHFHGLRDFYSLVKYTARKLDESGPCNDNKLSEIVVTGILRNFGGLPSEKTRILDFFRKAIPQLKTSDVSPLKLIQDNIADKGCRHLMLITNGDSVVSILENELNVMEKPFEIIFGSSFEEDLCDEYNYRILSRIILCMEQGIVLILKDLESIYGSLYDMLNQNYTIVGKKKNCRVALGQYSNPMCQVHDGFKCIVLVEESKLDFSDPPFLNRFEKQQFEFSDFIQNSEERTVVDNLNVVINDLCKIPKHAFYPHQVIPSYNDDLLVSLVNYTAKTSNVEALFETSLNNLLWIMPPEIVIRAKESALMDRNPSTPPALIEKYLLMPIHSGLEAFFSAYITDGDTSNLLQNQLFCIFTHASVHSYIPIEMGNRLVQKEKLAVFKSEKHFSSRIANFFSSGHDILIIQSILANDGHHMLLAKVTIEKQLRKYQQGCKEGSRKKCVCILAHAERGMQNLVPLTFLSGWKLLFLDSVTKHEYELPYYYSHDLQEVVKEHDVVGCIHESLFWALSNIKFSSSENSVKNLEDILSTLQRCTFAVNVLKDMIINYILGRTDYLESYDWVLNVAMDTQVLMQSGSFLNSLQNNIKDLTKAPLAMYLYKLIDLNIMSQVFVDDEFTIERRNVWKSIVKSREYVSIENIKAPSGPECFISHSNFLHLKMPGSQMINKFVELQKAEFTDIIREIRIKIFISPDEDLPLTIFNDACRKCTDIICRDALEAIITTSYGGCHCDFLDDFCNIHSIQLIQSMSEKQRIAVFKWTLMNYFNMKDFLKEDFKFIVASLNACVWVYGHVISAICKLAEIADSAETIDWDLRFDQYDADENQELPFDTNTNKTQLVNEMDYVFPFENEEQLPFGHDLHFDSSCKAHGTIKCVVESMIEDQTQHPKPMPNDDILSNEGSQRGGKDEQLSKYSLFIRSVCVSLLPTKSLFEKLPINGWLNLIRRMIPFASIISSESGELVSIKLCHDIAEVFISSDCEYLDYIHEIGSLLKENNCQINNIEICKYLFKLSKHLVATTKGNTSSFQKLFCSYVVRCIVTNPDSDIQLTFILSTITSKEIFIPKLTYMGQVLKIAIMTDIIDEDDETFNPYMDILNGNLDDENVSFARCFDVCLSSMKNIDADSLPFLTLLTDMIEENAIELDLETLKSIDSASNDILASLSNCRETIEEGQLSLRLICAIAMTRKFLKLYTEMFFVDENKMSSTSALSNHVNAMILTEKNKDQVSSHNAQSFHFLLKIIENVKGQEMINSSCEKLRPYLPALKSVTWNPKVVEMSQTFNPMCMYIKEEEFEYCLKQVITFGNEDNKLKSVVNMPDKTLPLFGVIVQRFYMKRCLAERTDTEKELTKSIKKVFEKCFTTHQRKIILPILDGVFKQKLFALSTIVEAPKHHMVSVMMHMVGLMFFMSLRGDSETNMWKNYVLKTDPKQSDSIPLITFESYIKHKAWPESLARYSPVVVCVLQIFLLSSNILSETFNFCETAEIEKKDNAEDVQTLQLSLYWNDLKEKIQLKFNDICLLIHIILNKSNMLFSPKTGYTDHLSNSNIIEQADIIDYVIRNRIEFLHCEMKKSNTDKGSHESCVLEIDSCGDGKCHLFRIPASADLEMLKVDVYTREDKTSFKLLEFILENIDVLSLPKYIFSFITWHLSVVSHGSYKHRKVDFNQLSVRKFIADEPEEKRRHALTKAFEMFSDDWNQIRKLKLGGYKDLEEFQLENMNKSVSMSECTILNGKSIMKRILDILIDIQNSTLNKAQSSLLNDTEFGVLGESKQVSLLDVKKRDLITFEWNDNWLRYSQPDTEYGKAKSIQFDFDRIEKEIQAEALVGKSKIYVPSLPTILFTDDLHHNSVQLLNEIKLLLPQKNVPMDVKKTIEKKRDTDSSLLSNLLTHIGMTLSLLRKTETKSTGTQKTSQLYEQNKAYKHSADLPITQYLDVWESITRMVPTVYKSIFPEDARLCHIVDLYQLLEEMNGDLVCDSLGDNYKVDLKKEEKEALRKLKESKIKFLEKLEHPLKVFVHRELAFRTNTLRPEQPLIDYIDNSDLWWHNDLDEDSEKKGIIVDNECIELKEIIPPEILVENIFEVVQFIKKALEDERKKKFTVCENYKPGRAQKKDTTRRTKKTQKFMRT